MFGFSSFTVVPNIVQCNTVTFDQQKREKKRAEMNVTGNKVIATIGRASYQKNPFFAMNVIKKLLETERNITFWWIGNGPLENEIVRYASQIGIQDRFNFLGKRSDVIELYQAIDCFFLPSFFEGLPVTGLEAQAMGLPMVVSDTITNELVYTDLVDYVSLDESTEVWSMHLKKALNRKSNRASYSEELKKSVFSNIGSGDRLAKVYKEMLQHHKRNN